MTESAQHVEMVTLILDWLDSNHPHLDLCVDSKAKVGCSQPPLIGGYRPDVLARIPIDSKILIGEAKTLYDVDTLHSYKQISSFLGYLNTRTGADALILSVPGQGADHAKFMIRQIYQSINKCRAHTFLLDQCDTWKFDPMLGARWHLL